MKRLRIAVYPGDGIGPEVIAQAERVLDAATGALGECTLSLMHFPWGINYWRETKRVVPDDYLAQLRPFDAILLGAVGWPAELPDHVTIAPLIQMRQAFDQYASVRPARLPPGVPSVLAGRGPADIDFVVVRENSEGEYVDIGGRVRRGQPEEYAVQSAVHTRRGIERVLRFGFELARQRRRELTMVTKSNALAHAFVLWDEVLEDVAPQFPDIKSRRLHADAAAMDMVRRPESFDVIVASNLFGDILTDLAGAISGGLGLAPSTNTNPERVFPSLFEPVHGSAPDIACRGVANPIAAILSAALMLDHLGVRGGGDRIRHAVDAALLAGCRTPDLGGTMTTIQMGDAILRHLDQRS